MPNLTESIRDNLSVVEERIQRALARCGRPREAVTLVAVSKTHPVEALIEAARAGLGDLGENYAQEMAAKRQALLGLAGKAAPFDGSSPCPQAGADSLPPVRFHFIGPLQTNKVKLVVGGCHLLHTVDRLWLAEAVSTRSASLGLTQDILFEVHLSPEDSKSGASPEALPDLLRRCLELPGLRPLGLMTMPPWGEDPEESRPYFARLRRLLEDLSHQFGLSDFRHLSMGMSHDFEVALEEGATLIRVGTALFGARG